MKGTVWIGSMLVSMTLLVALPALSMDDKPSDQDAMMEACMQLAAPGEFHAHLKPLSGKWETKTKWRMTPDAPWDETTGVAEFEWIMGGRFLLQKVKGAPAEDMPPFEGMGIMGYDNLKKKYTSAWIDNMGTAIMTMLGECDASGTVVTMYGTADDPMTGMNKKYKSIGRILNNTKHTFEMYETGPDGKEFKSLEVTYMRR